MNKYKIGDHVVVEESNIESTKKLAGETGVIKDILPDRKGYDYLVKMDNGNYSIWCKVKCYVRDHQIIRVIFNDPATIIMWADGTKTVAKCVKGDKYDPEKGFAIAYAKKFGGKTFREEMDKWCAPIIDEKAKNEPLTMEELMKMDGKRVWLSSMWDGEERFNDSYCGWHTVNLLKHRVEDALGCGYNISEMGKRMGYRAYMTPQTGKKG